MAKRYEKVRTIGRGGFSTVYLVRDTQLGGEKCVLKEMDIVQMSAAEQEMAKQEVQVLRSYNHPNIIQYRDNFLHKGKLNIVMEHASGGDLYQKIRKQGTKSLSESQIRRWTCEILSALKCVHDRKMIHRDLKPQNVFLMSDNTVKIGDFGIAKDLANTRAAHTQIGTPFYISPEICHNKSYDAKSDMWSLGCLIHEMCVLKPPFMADDLKAMMKRICYSAPCPIPGHYSKELSQLVTSLLNKNPRERPDAQRVAGIRWIAEILTDLESLNSPAEVTAYPPLSVASRFDADAASVVESSSSGGSRSPTARCGRGDVIEGARMRARRGRSKDRGMGRAAAPEEAAAKIQAAFRDSRRWKAEKERRKESMGRKAGMGRARPVKQFRPNPLQIKEKRKGSVEYNHMDLMGALPACSGIGEANNGIDEAYMVELSQACQRHHNQQNQQLPQQVPYRPQEPQDPYGRGEGGREVVPVQAQARQCRRGSAPPWAGHYESEQDQRYAAAMKPQARYREAVEKRRHSVQESVPQPGRLRAGSYQAEHHRKAKSHSPPATQMSGTSLSPGCGSDPGLTERGVRLPCIHKSVSPPQFANYGEGAPRRGVAAPRERMVAGGAVGGRVNYAPVPPWGGDERFEQKGNRQKGGFVPDRRESV